MLDSRTRLVILVLLTTAHTSAKGVMVLILAGITILAIAVYWRSFLRGIHVIGLTMVAILFFVTVIWLIGVGLSSENLVIGFLRWVSLATLTVVLVLTMNALEVVTSLVYFRIPVRVALAFGIGLRFLPVILDEARRIRIVNRQYGVQFSHMAVRKFGILDLLNRLTGPLLIAVLRRVDSLIISIGVQQLEQRIKNYKFQTLTTLDILAVLVSLLICVLSWLQWHPTG